jgi:hypothetical protein
MNKKILILLSVIFIVFTFVPFSMARASQVWVVAKISNAQNASGSFCLPIGTQMNITGISNSTTTTAVSTCAGDSITSPLINLSSGSHNLNIVIPSCSSYGGKLDGSGRCWFTSTDPNTNCTTLCQSEGLTTLSAKCCETDPNCVMLDELLPTLPTYLQQSTCSSCTQDYPSNYAYPPPNAWYGQCGTGEAKQAQCLSGAGNCGYNGWGNYIICTCSVPASPIFSFSFTF